MEGTSAAPARAAAEGPLSQELEIEFDEGPTGETAAFLGPEEARDRARLELRDVHALHGGRQIVVHGTGEAQVRVVLRGRYERRYQLRLEPDEARRLLRLAAEDDVLTARAATTRPGIPGEASPELVLVNPAGEERQVSKWSRDVVPRFDRALAQLRALEARTEGLTPTREGPFSW